ncbi:hypothetical protein Dimus_020674 [Dionaea muscipula]
MTGKQSAGELAGLEARRDGRAGRLILRRPQALNALDLAMVRALHNQLRLWRDDPDIEIVIVEGEGRAFCAGGDVRQVRADVLAGAHDAAQGVCMGGGLGISVHGSDPVVTETALLAMPETAIGLTPDIGASYFLPRLPGFVGTFMGLTGARLSGADAVHAGLATAFVPGDRLADLTTALAQEGQGAIARFAAPLPAYSLAPVLPAISEVFSADSLPDMVARLEAMGSDWAQTVLAELRRQSPSALCWSLASLRSGARHDLDAALAAELRLVTRIIRQPDFIEGVRAMLVDKDRSPRWQPAWLEDVDPRLIEDLFRP